jgi:hypothetical protein
MDRHPSSNELLTFFPAKVKNIKLALYNEKQRKDVVARPDFKTYTHLGERGLPQEHITVIG